MMIQMQTPYKADVITCSGANGHSFHLFNNRIITIYFDDDIYNVHGYFISRLL